MTRAKKASAPTLPELVREAGSGAPGEKLIAIVEREIRIADAAMLIVAFSHRQARDAHRQRRMRLGRLLHWLRQGSIGTGATAEDGALYAQIVASRAGKGADVSATSLTYRAQSPRR